MPAYVFDKKTNKLVKVAGNAANADLKNMNVYSTEEKIVGTWIDGKPIYRKCYNITLAKGLVTIDAIANIDTYLGCKGSYISSSNNKLSIPWIGANTEYTDVFINTSGNVITTSSLTGTNCVIVIKYTKTTD